MLYNFKAAITQVVSKLTKIANRLKQLMTREFDVLVIGTGTSGYTLALACREAERSVAVADNRPYGGTCAMRGCQPKKYLVAGVVSPNPPYSVNGIPAESA